MKMNSVVKLCTLTAAICAANASYAAGAQTATVTIHATVAPSVVFRQPRWNLITTIRPVLQIKQVQAP